MSVQITVGTATSGAIATSAAVTVPAKLACVSLHFNTAPTTSESFTVTLDAAAGAAYDTVLLSTNPSVGSVKDIVFFPDGDFWVTGGDAIDLAYTNTDGRTYGVRIVLDTG